MSDHNRLRFCDFVADSEGFPRVSQSDWHYSNPVCRLKVIPCQRDSEDYAPTRFAGVTDLIPNLPAGYTITLSWADPGTAPGINIFRATDPTGQIGYLTTTPAADTQIGANGFYVGSVSSFQTMDLTQKFAENAGNPSRKLSDNFIFCSTTPGSGELLLQVKDPNSAVVTQTSIFIEIKDIKSFYESWTAGDVFTAGSNLTATPLPTAKRENELPNRKPGSTHRLVLLFFTYPV